MKTIPNRKKKLKTPERLLANARNWYRRKKGIPVDAPIGTRSEPFNGPRRGTGNEERKISMPPEAWRKLDEIRRGRTRGEFVEDAINTVEEISDLIG